MGDFPPSGRISAWGAGYRLLGRFSPARWIPVLRAGFRLFLGPLFPPYFLRDFSLYISRRSPSYQVLNSFEKNCSREIMASSFDVALSGWLSSLGV